jgi:hypothetical protein
MKKVVISGLLLVLSLLIVAPSASAQADVGTILTHTSLTANLRNPCNGEFVATEADQFDIRHQTTTPGGVHFHLTTEIQGVGIGLTTGAKYQLSAVSTANINFQGASEQTLWQDFVFSAQGDVPNFLVQLVRHFTIDANGDLVVKFTDRFTKCN